MNNYTILVCDDDRDIVDAIEIYLSNEGYKILKAYSGLSALKILESSNSHPSSNDNQIHLIIMDIMMPEMDGFATTRKIRETMNTPIIFLSAKSEDTDKILGLNFGADDYITKPFNPLELIARCKAQLRRYVDLGNIAAEKNLLINGAIVMDMESKMVYVDDKPKTFTATEWKILELFMRNIGKVFSMNEIYETVWQEEPFIANNTVAVHIRRIREKIEIDTKDPKYIKVVWGIGYKMEQNSVPSVK